MDEPRRFQPNQTNEPVRQAPAPTPEPTTPASEPMLIPKKKSGAKRWFLRGLAILLIAGLGAFAYWQYTDVQNVRAELSSVQSERDTLKAAAAKAADKNDSAEDTETVTTQQLADKYAASYKKSGSGVTFFTRVDKISGDAVLLYTKAEAPNAQPENFVLKRVDDTLVQLAKYEATLSKTEADMLKNIYGVDVKTLGVSVAAN